MASVSIVVPCYNPPPFLKEALASARAQTCGPVEIVLVNDGSTDPASIALLETAARQADRYIEQPSRGLGAARNAGFRAASSEFVIPLDADDLLEPDYARVCVEAAKRHPDAAFVYTDYEVFGTRRYVERVPEYNFYRLLDWNTVTYAALIRHADWEDCGGYDESLTRGYEDWEFWLRLGSRGRFGRRAGGALFRYRKHGPSLLDVARRHHDEIVAQIRSKHAALYSPAGRAAVKARWEPSVCILGAPSDQTLADCSFIRDTHSAPAGAGAFLTPDAAAPLDPHSGEYAALAVWGGKAPLRLPDGSVARSREQLVRGDTAAVATKPCLPMPSALSTLQRHLVNAELLSLESWLRHPLRSALRLVPLRWKERMNRAAGRPVFNLDFYLQFQPGSTLLGGALLNTLDYIPRSAGARPRVALVTPHLGPGGAENVLLEIAASLGRAEFEILLLAAQSRDNRWIDRWREAADHVYDLAALAAPEKLPAAVCSVILNWRPDTVLLQNTAIAYAVLPRLHERLPETRLLDLVHAVDDDWSILSATAPVAGCLDLRVAVSQTVRRRLIETGYPAERVCVVSHGIDLARFPPQPPRDAPPYKILFAGRLDPVKRPLLLPEVARELCRLQSAADFRFVVAGDGPESSAVARRAEKLEVRSLFDFLGHTPDVAPLLADCDALVLPSRSEGIPLVILEAFAARRPVVASAVGGVPEVVSPATGVLIPAGGNEAGAFAAALDALLKDPERRRAMGEAGRALVETAYNRDAARARYRALFS